MQTQASETLSAKACLGIFLFLIGSLVSSLRIVVEAPNPVHMPPDLVGEKSDQRFAAVKLRLPKTGVIGYIGETGESATPDYYLAQYALAPLVVDRSANHAIVLGNFSPSHHREYPANLQLVGEFGDGVFLFSNKDAQ